MTEWRKAIPQERDKLQSRVLVWCVVPLLAVPSCILIVLALHPHNAGFYALRSLIVSLTFGVLVWALRAATPAATICGSLMCLLITSGTWTRSGNPLDSALSPLIVLFILIFGATRAGKRRKIHLGVAEGRRGRNAAQIVANLGAAALAAAAGVAGYSISAGKYIAEVAVLAALCEATADTVSSEIGQAFGGTPFLLTTFRRVPAGTDGAVSALGTAAGILASGLVALTGMWSMHLNGRLTAIAFSAGVAGLVFDSVLGATVERRGWLGNDLVNFSSTLFAALFSLALLPVFRP